MAHEILTEREAAKALRISRSTLQRMRQRGEGPSFVALSARRIGYLSEEIENYVSKKQFRSTTERDYSRLESEATNA